MTRALRFGLVVLVLAGGCQQRPPSEPQRQLTPAGRLTETDVVPYLSGALVPGRNHVYCATFQIAWDELRQKLGEKEVALEPASPMAAALNAGSFPRSGLSPECCLAMAGWTHEGIIEKIDAAMRSRFPQASMPTPPADGIPALHFYAYLDKTLSFRASFERLGKPLMFGAAGQKVPVRAFGCDYFTGATPHDAGQMKQVQVLDYASDDDFVLAIGTANEHERIVLAKVPPQATLAETIAAARRRIESPAIDSHEQRIERGESLRVPIIEMAVDRRFDELIGRQLTSAAGRGYPITEARQAIKFRLDERGARLESYAHGKAASIGPPRLRHFVFDRPFLLYLEEGPDLPPYFAAWIGSAELLSAAPPTAR